MHVLILFLKDVPHGLPCQDGLQMGHDQMDLLGPPDVEAPVLQDGGGQLWKLSGLTWTLAGMICQSLSDCKDRRWVLKKDFSVGIPTYAGVETGFHVGVGQNADRNHFSKPTSAAWARNAVVKCNFFPGILSVFTGFFQSRKWYWIPEILKYIVIIFASAIWTG